MRAGSWVTCENNYAHKKVKMGFFKTPDYPHDYCHLCLDAIRLKNQRMFGHESVRTTSYINHLTESKPEKDSL